MTVTKQSPDLMMVIHSELARRLARPALHLQLRHLACEGRAVPHRRRRQRHHLRRARLLDADLARSREARRPQPDRGRRGRPRCAGRTSRSPPASSISRRCRSRARSSSTSRPKVACPTPEAFGNIIVKSDDQRPRGPRPRRRRASSSAPPTTTAAAISTSGSPFPWAFSSGPARTRWPRRRWCRTRWPSCRSRSRTACATTSSTTRRCSSRNRSKR